MTFSATIQFDGYHVGDRLLEGVMFEVLVTIEGPEDIIVEEVTVAPDAEEYFRQLNQPMWYDIVKDAVEENPFEVWENIDEETWKLIQGHFVEVGTPICYPDGGPVPLE